MPIALASVRQRTEPMVLDRHTALSGQPGSSGTRKCRLRLRALICRDRMTALGTPRTTTAVSFAAMELCGGWRRFRMFESPFPTACLSPSGASPQWSNSKGWKFHGPKVGQKWAKFGPKTMPTMSAHLLTVEEPYLSVAREGFEPPTFSSSRDRRLGTSSRTV